MLKQNIWLDFKIFISHVLSLPIYCLIFFVQILIIIFWSVVLQTFWLNKKKVWQKWAKPYKNTNYLWRKVLRIPLDESEVLNDI